MRELTVWISNCSKELAKHNYEKEVTAINTTNSNELSKYYGEVVKSVIGGKQGRSQNQGAPGGCQIHRETDIGIYT